MGLGKLGTPFPYCFLVSNGNKENTVGMPVTQHPPHRSVHEELPHTAPTSGHKHKVADKDKGA